MKIFDYEEVKMNWDSFTYPIAVGTPVSIDGVLADNASAHGLIARTVFAKPDADETLKVMTGGTIDMEEIVAGYGQELSSAAVQALCGIHFYKDGVCIPTGGSGGGGSDDQKWHETTTTQLFSETVTTAEVEGCAESMLEYSTEITADALTITVNGVEYVCSKNNDGGYGATLDSIQGTFDFSEYPFALNPYWRGPHTFDGYSLVTENPGTYTISASAETVTTTKTFNNEVDRLIGDYLTGLGGVVVETTNPNEASFCTVKVNNITTSHYVTIRIKSDGTISYTNDGVMNDYYNNSYILVKSHDAQANANIFVNGGIARLTPPGDLSTGRLQLRGIMQTSVGSDASSFTLSDDTWVDYADLEVHYFAVKSSSEDSGGDSPIIPDGPIDPGLIG